MHPLIAIPATIALVVRAYRRNSLTGPAIVWAALTAIVHALHPSSLPFTLLVVFFLLGTAATKVKHDVKATLTLSSSGSSGGEGPRHSIQVLANSGMASLLCLFHVQQYGIGARSGTCFAEGGKRNLILLGIISNYAAVTADTLSSELGILSKSRPRLITSLKTVPPGTNGGVTAAGILGGVGGSAVIGILSVVLLNFCDTSKHAYILSETNMIGFKNKVVWTLSRKFGLVVAVTSWGVLGSLLDSWLGAVLQASIIDRKTGKVVEGAGGSKVLLVGTRTRVHSDGESKKQVSRSVGSGRDVLDNNQVNMLMAAVMSIGGMVVGGKIVGLA